METKKAEADEIFGNVLLEVLSYNPDSRVDFLKKAYEFSKKAHKGQKRLSGEDFIIHPLEVLGALAAWKLDDTTLVSGLLHDTVEDSEAKISDIEEKFGAEVARIVSGVTKITDIRLVGKSEDLYAENLRKMILAMAEDLRVVFVKLADRLHNMKTLNALPKDKRIANARETLDIYAPLSERLGLGFVKGKLEDLAFPFVYPEEYKKVVEISKDYYKKANLIIKKMEKRILQSLAKEKIRAKVNGREKHLYSLWRKLERPDTDWDFGKIYDIVALRILVEGISDCYVALGVVHDIYKPNSKIGVSDFIAQPKPNGYRSIHTKVFVGERVVEVQIRTFKMHSEAEFGAAAHWMYSDKKAKNATPQELEKGAFKVKKQLRWISELAGWQSQMRDSKEFLEAVRFDAFKERIFIFSPKGDVYNLPLGATPVDFAYSVHTDLGNFIKLAKVNGKVVSLDTKLSSGDVCEIVKQKNSKKPNKYWLDFVVTTTARREILKADRDE